MKSAHRVFSSFVGTYHRPDRCEHQASPGTTIAPHLKQSSQHGGKCAVLIGRMEELGVAAHLELSSWMLHADTHRDCWLQHQVCRHGLKAVSQRRRGYSGACPIASVISSCAWMYSSCDCRKRVLASSSRACAAATCERRALPFSSCSAETRCDSVRNAR